MCPSEKSHSVSTLVIHGIDCRQVSDKQLAQLLTQHQNIVALLNIETARRATLNHPAEQQGTSPANQIGAFSAREGDVFRLIGRGHSTAEIAILLGVSRSTIDTYRGRLKTKLNIRSGTELVRAAVLADGKSQ